MPLGALIPLNWGVGSSLVWLALSSRRRKDLEKGGFLWPGTVGGGFLKEGSEGRNGRYSLAGDREDDLPAGEGQAGIRPELWIEGKVLEGLLGYFETLFSVKGVWQGPHV